MAKTASQLYRFNICYRHLKHDRGEFRWESMLAATRCVHRDREVAKTSGSLMSRGMRMRETGDARTLQACWDEDANADMGRCRYSKGMREQGLPPGCIKMTGLHPSLCAFRNVNALHVG